MLTRDRHSTSSFVWGQVFFAWHGILITAWLILFALFFFLVIIFRVYDCLTNYVFGGWQWQHRRFGLLEFNFFDLLHHSGDANVNGHSKHQQTVEVNKSLELLNLRLAPYLGRRSNFKLKIVFSLKLLILLDEAVVWINVWRRLAVIGHVCLKMRILRVKTEVVPTRPDWWIKHYLLFYNNTSSILP